MPAAEVTGGPVLLLDGLDPEPPATDVVSRLPAAAAQRWLPVLSVIVTLAVLEGVARTGLVSADVLPRMSSVAARLGQELLTQQFWSLTTATLQGWAAGLAAGTLAGVVLGAIFGLLPGFARLFVGVLEFVRPIPSIALIPLAIIALGTGMETKVTLVFVGALWPVLIQTMLGIRSVDLIAQDTVRSFQVPRRGQLLRLVLPSALPHFFTGLRVSSSVALIVAITVELIVGAKGLGRAVNVAQQSGSTDLMYAYIVVVGLLGFGVNALFQAAEKRALHWHISTRRDAL